MRVASLLYHDVVAAGAFGTSGFAGGDADVYKLTRDAFAAHVREVSRVAEPPGTVEDVLASPRERAVLFTFDDGGVGAYTHTAPILEAAGWRGHFFVSTNWIDAPGFLSAAQIRDLHQRGHVIASHSCSHPPRISHCAPDELRAEWRESVSRLQDVTGAPVRVASVPGGFYTAAVADAAVEAGITALFNSEPTAIVRRHRGCAVLGRFSLMRDSPPALARDFAAGRAMPQIQQLAYWNAKKLVKAVGGERWLALRKRLLSAS